MKVNKICVVGLGYVGLPLAVEFAKKGEKIIGYDKDEGRVEALKKGYDYTNEIRSEDLENYSIDYTSNPKEISKSNFIIIAMPTPITEAKIPDLSYVENASMVVGKYMKKNSIVVYESTVYPGVTEDVCKPVLENVSGMKCGLDFKIGYSPERVNPGDKEHTIDKIVKVIAGMDKESLDVIDSVYSKITKTYRSGSIKEAEAAKVIENIQRDLNIALMNELAIIFDKMNINVENVLDAASTKWNFHKYHPGLVGGHCISVDPYYLTFKAEELGYHPQVILAGRRINDDMHKFYADKVIHKLVENDIKLKGANVLVMGLTFKPNVKDCRNSRVRNLIEELKTYGINVFAHDPLLSDETVEREFGVKNYVFNDIMYRVDFTVLAVKHKAFDELMPKIDSSKLFVI